MITKIYEKFKVNFYKTYLSANDWASKSGVTFGSDCKFNKDISFGSEPYLINIGKKFYCSTGIKFITHDGSVNVLRNLHLELRQADIFGRIEIGDNVFIGANAVLLPGTKIGDNVIVGACSLVKGELTAGYVYAGVPVRKICTLDEYKKKHELHIHKTKSLNKELKKKYLLENFLK